MIKCIKPITILNQYIQNYFIVETDNLIDFLPKERVYPCGNVSMVFHYASPSKFKKKNSTEYIEPNLVICGQQTNFYDISLSGKTGMILIIFKPHGVKPFFNFPITELLNKNLSLNDLANSEAAALEDKLFNSADNKQRINHLEKFLINRLVYYNDFERIEHAIKLIENYKGQVRAQDIAQEVCLGIKQFERNFSKYVGLNPKKYASIVRFQNIIQITGQPKNSNMYELAFDNGYYDQSHFIHDFKSFTGLTPRQFFSDKR